MKKRSENNKEDNDITNCNGKISSDISLSNNSSEESGEIVQVVSFRIYTHVLLFTHNQLVFTKKSLLFTKNNFLF